MRLLSWNVNGIRAAAAKGFLDWLAASQADIVGIQETKAHPEQLDASLLAPAQYTSHWCSSQRKKGYSGVAAYTRQEPLRCTHELPDALFQDEGRLLHLEYPSFHYCNVYFPNGQMSEERLAYKMGYYASFLTFAEHLRQTKPLVICGDFNTAHRPIDLARPKQNEGVSGFLPIERAFLDTFIGHGYVDAFRHLHQEEEGQYSWWSYRTKARASNTGWRIDYFFISEELLPNLRRAWIDMDVAGSDHCPVGIELDIPLTS